MNDINEVEFERGIIDCRMGKPVKVDACESYLLGYEEEYTYQQMADHRSAA